MSRLVVLVVALPANITLTCWVVFSSIQTAPDPSLLPFPIASTNLVERITSNAQTLSDRVSIYVKWFTLRGGGRVGKMGLESVSGAGGLSLTQGLLVGAVLIEDRQSARTHSVIVVAKLSGVGTIDLQMYTARQTWKLCWRDPEDNSRYLISGLVGLVGKINRTTRNNRSKAKKRCALHIDWFNIRDNMDINRFV